MRRFIPYTTLLIMQVLALGQAPLAFNYQAILRDSDGAVLSTQSALILLSIVNEEGSPVYSESHNTQTNAFGLVNLTVGQGSSTDEFSAINWANGPFFLQITVNGTLMGSSQLLSVPYALFAASGNEGPPGEPGPQGEPGPKGDPGDSISDELLKRMRFLEVLNGVDTLSDIEGNVYRTIRIGNQVWMSENLYVAQYSDGAAIPVVKDSSVWDGLALTDRAFCWYNNDTLNFKTYGALYTWSAAMNGAASCDVNPSWVQGVCPDGFHIPSDKEWQELEIFLGMSEGEAGSNWKERGQSVAQKLKESGTTHWRAPNGGATNESGFTALPGGIREKNGGFWGGMGLAGYFWTSAETDEHQAFARRLFSDSYIYRDGVDKKSALSVRCVKGAGANLAPNVVTTEITQITTNSVSLGGEVVSDGGTDVTARGVCWSTSPGPIAIQNATADGVGQGKFTSNISGLTPGTKYYVRAYAKNSQATTYGQELSFVTWTGSLSDIDGNSYATIQIGNQNWMAENLGVTHYADGTEIPLIVSDESWGLLNNGDKAFCWINDNASLGDTYGALYTYAAASNGIVGGDSNPSGIQGVCPDGWHLPSDSEWKELEMYLGMSQEHADSDFTRGTDEGGKLKETGTSHWSNPNEGATNESGFTALPGGYRHSYFSGEGHSAVFWTASNYDSQYSWYRSVWSGDAGIRRGRETRKNGLSVRCIED